MGLFSSKKIVTVSSTLYNLAGPEEDRPDYMKGTLFSSIMANSQSVTDDITSSYFTGPGIKQRRFFSYADRNNLRGLPQTTISNNDPIPANDIVPHVPNPDNYGIQMSSASVSHGDPEPFVLDWIITNEPLRINDDYVYDYEAGQFSIQFENGDFFTWTDNRYSPSKKYIWAEFYYFNDSSEGDVVPTDNGRVFTQADLTGWTEVSNVPSFVLSDLTRSADVTITGNDGRDPVNYQEDASLSDQSLNRTSSVHERTVVKDLVGSSISGELQRYSYVGDDHVTNDYTNTIVTNEDIGGGVILTTTRVVTGEQVTTAWTELYETQDVFNNDVIENRVFIYEVGSGNSTLDALAQDADASNYQEFYPFLPIRLDNVGVSEEPYKSNGTYEETKKAYRKATEESFDKLIEIVEDNDDIDDIDYAYMIYGVSLNARDHKARLYVMEYYRSLMQVQNAGANWIDDLNADIAAHNQWKTDYQNWQNQMNNLGPEDWQQRTDPPSRVDVKQPPTSQLRLTAFNGGMGFDIRLPWVSVTTEIKSGTPSLTDPDNGVSVARAMKQGEVIIKKSTSITWTESEERVYGGRDEGSETITTTHTIPSFKIYHQIGSNQYEEMTVYGAKHLNYIYDGKSVDISAAEALDDDDESGFVVPLHAPTLKNMGLVDATQVATANTHILFNSYEVTKQKWYQRGIFKILLIILVIVIAVVIFPGAFAAGGGILGGNLALGAALGLSGTAALVAGVVANYLASIVISQLLSIVGTALFGEKWGAVFAAIAGFALSMGISGTSLFSAQGIFGLSNALMNGYSGYLQGEIGEMAEQSQEDYERYEDEMERIQDLIESLGGNDLNFNPMFFTENSGNGGQSRGYLPETADQFIQRTTMSGTDLVEITLAMVSDYAEIQRTLPRN